ncbi:MAG TPA: hypothetical protein VHE11_07490 [Steroidobacteraceae bacterium]|nr:hypothetical protein [Steroidobacteraceae bacterium]
MYHGFHGFPGFWLIGAIIAIIPFWRICDRAGLSPWLSLLLLIPLANIIFVYYVAFAEWPSQRGGTGSAPPGFGPGAGTGPGPTPT